MSMPQLFDIISILSCPHTESRDYVYDITSANRIEAYRGTRGLTVKD